MRSNGRCQLVESGGVTEILLHRIGRHKFHSNLFDLSAKLLKNLEGITLLLHGKKAGIFTEIINKHNVTAEAKVWNSGSESPNIRVNKLERSRHFVWCVKEWVFVYFWHTTLITQKWTCLMNFKETIFGNDGIEDAEVGMPEPLMLSLWRCSFPNHHTWWPTWGS